jgi:hypothetical protein
VCSSEEARKEELAADVAEDGGGEARDDELDGADEADRERGASEAQRKGLKAIHVSLEEGVSEI